jgi:hypothetical protein
MEVTDVESKEQVTPSGQFCSFLSAQVMMENKVSLSKRILLLILTALLFVAGWPARAGYAQTYEFEECEAIEERALRDELNTLAQSIFSTGRQQLNVAAIVDRQWIELEVDSTIDREIERAVDRIYRNENYWNRFLSGWSSEKAREFTTKIATDAFGSEAFREQIDALSTAVAEQISSEMTAITAQSASSALLCVQSFIGDSYSDTMAALFEVELQQKVAEVDLADVDASVIPLLQSHTRTLAGIGVIIGSQIARRLVQQISHRIAGKVVGRIVGKAAASAIPVAGWIIGGGLIVWDLIEGGRGALPQIQDALQEESVKAGIRSEVTYVIEDELRKELPAVARAVSNDVYSSWIDFKSKYTQVLALAEENPHFRAMVDKTSTEEVGKLATLVVVGEQALGSEGLDKAIEEGTLEQIFYLPQEALQILRATANPQLVLAWADLAGADLARVVNSELYKVASPESFADRQEMQRILVLEDRDAIAEIMLLNRLERDVLLNLPRARLLTLSAQFNEEDLRWLATYIAQMQPREANLLVERLLRDPGLMDKLRNEPVRQAVVESKDVEETLAFLSNDPKEAQRTPVETVGKVIEDTERLLSGQVTWLLYWQKYGTWRNTLIILGALVALFVVFKLFWRRTQPVHVTVNLPEPYRGRE